MSEKLFAPTRWLAVTPSDTAYLEPYPVALHIGGDGNVAMEGEDGNSEVFQGLTAGSILVGQPRRVLSTGTTATNIIALYN